jgi:hypothetical protein
MRAHKFSVIVVAIVLAGCISQIVPFDEYVKGWVGGNIEEMRTTMSRPNSYASRIGWKETTYKLPNGNWVFVEPEPRCLIHWEVNQQGIIVGFKTVGGSCS